MTTGTLQNQQQFCVRAQWVLGVGLLLIVACFFAFGFTPADNEQRRLRDSIETQRRELMARQSRTSNLPVVQLEVEKLKLKLDQFDKKLPRNPDLGDFVKQITQVSQQSLLRKLSVQPGMPKRSELYCEMPVTLKFEGEFQSVEKFIRQAEDMQRLTRIRNLTIRTRDAKSGQVEVNLTMNIYYLEG